MGFLVEVWVSCGPEEVACLLDSVQHSVMGNVLVLGLTTVCSRLPRVCPKRSQERIAEREGVSPSGKETPDPTCVRYAMRKESCEMRLCEQPAPIQDLVQQKFDTEREEKKRRGRNHPFANAARSSRSRAIRSYSRRRARASLSRVSWICRAARSYGCSDEDEDD